MPKVSDEHRAAKRAEIIDAAIRVLMRNGYARSSMADIIAESGMSAGAIYGYFPGKQDILRAVAEQVLGRRLAEIEVLSADHVPSPSEVLRAILTGIAAEPFSGVVVQLWGEASTDAQLRANLMEVFAHIRATLTTVVIAWGRDNPDRLPTDVETWAPRVAVVLASLGPGFMLFRSLLDDFDEAHYLAGIELALGLEPPRVSPAHPA